MPELDVGGRAADDLDDARPPADEFDVEGFESNRRGAHRARPGAVWRWGPTVLTVATVVAVVVAVAAALVLVGPRGIADLVSGGAGAAALVDPAEPAADGPDDPAADEPAAATAPTEVPAVPAGAVDRSVRVVVLNGTTTTGLAARAAQDVAGLGWTVERTGNDREPPSPTTVHFSDPGLEATAAALAADVGGVVRQDSAFDDPLTVVLGADYTS